MKKKVLVVIQLLRRGGIEIAAVNFASHLDKNKYDITYYLQNTSKGQDEELVKSVLKSGSKIITKESSNAGYLNGLKDALRVMRAGKYDIVHSHVMFYNGIIMLAAKMSGIKKRVSHSHATEWNRKETLPFKIYRAFMRKLINMFATDKLACSTAAGNYMYGKKEYTADGTFLANGIEIERYALSNDTRAKKRAELSISKDEILVGHIGTIYRIKNQVFLVEIFAEMLKSNSNLKLILAGEIVDGDIIKEKSRELGVEDKVFMLGQRTDVAELLQAFDIMIFPSLNEGLPVSLIEAQASKLPCLISDRVTAEVKFNSNVDFMPLEVDAEKWSSRAFELLKTDRNGIDITALSETYDINKVAQKLDGIYSAGVANDQYNRSCIQC